MARIKDIVALLEGVIGGVIPAKDALKRWPEIDAGIDDAAAQAWHHLAHFASDEDIRERDTDYAKYQKTILQSHVDELRSKHSISK